MGWLPPRTEGEIHSPVFGVPTIQHVLLDREKNLPHCDDSLRLKSTLLGPRLEHVLSHIPLEQNEIDKAFAVRAGLRPLKCLQR